MTPRTLFTIILKILGILFLKDFLVFIPQILSVILFMTRSETIGEALWTFGTTLIILFAYAIAAWYLVLRTDLIIDKLKLDRGFDQETIPINMHRSTVLSISVIVIGGLLVVDELPNFCKQLFSYFQEKRMTYGQTRPNISYSVLSGLKIIIGILLMAKQRQLVNYIELQRKK